MPHIPTNDRNDAYEVGRAIMDRMLTRNDFVLADKSDYATALFESCLLNCSMLVHAHAYGCCVAEREKARRNMELKSTATITELVATKQMVASVLKLLLTQNNLLILMSTQAHLTRLNFDNAFPEFITAVFNAGIDKFRAEESA